MAELITDYSVERDALLYVMSDCKLKGWRLDLLVEKLAESEEKFLLCSSCNGLLRDACFYEEGLRCAVCIPEGVALLPVKMNQTIVNQKMVICLLLFSLGHVKYIACLPPPSVPTSLPYWGYILYIVIE